MKKRFAASAMILAMSAATVLSPLTTFAEAEEQELNIAIFQGGYGDAYWNQMVELFEASHEGVKVNMTISPTIGDIIRPQIVAGNAPDFTPPLHPIGSAFRQSVWEILLQIPYGKTTTYGEIARQLSEKMGLSRMSAQAVGGAVGHNEISIIIPCHRVVGTNGSLTGYAGGIDKKGKLLELEQTDMTGFFVPKKGTAL